MIQLQLPDEMQARLEARARDSDYADVADYLRDLISAQLDDSREMTLELAKALEEGEASGIDPRKRWIK
ncbi:type II toxin-antitoxin system ParD family antitoxin [Sphingomonas sp. LM7]|uniref:type II toxin-antitoxin system ParD family antitoxin n=1 Tax=Sphingomonas sp. LM7 TaxID=1938607 RepID=UPI0015C58171|nr:type II toxin-antitoxin system ParD family antitoxin [Sphingomonas sp. LM7]